ncbi:hypothetical protein CW304_04160 [Bacillus sp. UFRGS-B20]|nr:hypothetical protein CW304_04160 [Bacillus sp. UFRGS-B20]
MSARFFVMFLSNSSIYLREIVDYIKLDRYIEKIVYNITSLRDRYMKKIVDIFTPQLTGKYNSHLKIPPEQDVGWGDKLPINARSFQLYQWGSPH